MQKGEIFILFKREMLQLRCIIIQYRDLIINFFLNENNSRKSCLKYEKSLDYREREINL